MTKIKILTILIIVFFAYCCNSVEKRKTTSIQGINEASNMINIDLDKDADVKNLSSLFKKVTPIILEEVEESLISNINKIVVYEDLLFINDIGASNGVFVFRIDGKFMRKIGSVGQGPEEYLLSSDFTIDNENKKLYLLDGRLNKINIYELPEGKYINSIKLQEEEVKSRFIEYCDEKLYADADSYIETENDYMLREIDINTGNSINSWLSNEMYNKNYNNRLEQNTLFLIGRPFYASPTYGLKFIGPFMDIIVAIDKEGITPIMSISSENLLTREELHIAWNKNRNSNIITTLASTYKIYNIHNYIEGPNFIHISYFYGPTLRSAIYNKTNGSVEITKGFLDDLTFEIDFGKNEFGITPNLSYSDKDGVYGYIGTDNIEQLLSLLDEGKLNLGEEQLQKLRQLSSDSNPIVLHYEYE